MSKSWENAGGEKGRSHSHTFFFLSSLPLLRLPARSPFSREKDLSRSRRNVYRNRKKTGEATRSTQKERGIATVSIRLLSIIAWEASVSVRFRSKARGARFKYDEKNGALFRLSFLSSRGQNSSVFLCSETKRKRLATQAISIKECKGRDI